MTPPSILATDGQAAGPMLTTLSADEFAARCRALVASFAGDELHLQLDWLLTDLLTSWGYGEGMAIFLRHAIPYHTPKDTQHG